MAFHMELVLIDGSRDGDREEMALKWDVDSYEEGAENIMLIARMLTGDDSE